jgi:hypothetical protein
LLAYPLWKLLWEVVAIVHSIEEKRGVKAREILQIAKSVVLLLLIFQAIQLLNAFNGMGYVCGCIGMGLLVFQSSDAMLKTYSPQLAENMAKVVVLVEAVRSLESRFTSNRSFSLPSSGNLRPPHSESVSAAPPRVEEVGEEESDGRIEATPLRAGANHTPSASAAHSASAPPHHLMPRDDEDLPVATASVLLQALGETLSGALRHEPGGPPSQLRHRHKTKTH